MTTSLLPSVAIAQMEIIMDGHVQVYPSTVKINGSGITLVSRKGQGRVEVVASPFTSTPK
jgi:hypothetical protein